MFADRGMPALRVEAGEVFWEGKTSSLAILRLPGVALQLYY
jgi:hypothetical protein